MNKEAKLKELYKEYKERFEDKEIVLGNGSVDSKLVLVGEAPGKDEVKLGKPFVGMAGKNLEEFLNILELDRQNIYITNAIKYRLSKVNPRTGRVVNRPATKREIDVNRRYLLREISIIEPKYVVTLGNVPLKAIDKENGVSIGEAHGRLKTIIIEGKDYFLFPLYHPASVIYNRSLKDVYISDLAKLKEILN